MINPLDSTVINASAVAISLNERQNITTPVIDLIPAVGDEAIDAANEAELAQIRDAEGRTIFGTTAFIGSNTRQGVVDNPLLEYDSYTYCLSLHLMGIQNYNNLVSKNNTLQKQYVPQNVLISSAGRYGETFRRDPAFEEDFYFEDLKIKTIVNTTSRNRNSNLIECSFTIIEPLGFTLINRMLDAANRVNAGLGSYLQMPYMLEIDFFGSVDGGPPGPLKEHSKFIPIRLTNIKSKLTSRGTEYQIDAVPFNHQAFNQINVSLPVSTTVTATTVSQIFGGPAQVSASDNEFSVKLVNKANIEREISELRPFTASASGGFDARFASQARSKISDLTDQLNNEYGNFGITGFCAAINSYFSSLKLQNQISRINTVRVVFDAKIGNSKLYTTAGPVNAAGTPVSGTSTNAQKAQIQAASGAAKGQLRFDGATVNIPAGTTVDRMIDWAVRNSEYISEQLKDPTITPAQREGVISGGNPNTVTWLRWFKIIPNIYIREYDPTQNRYSMDVVFYVKPYNLSAKHPFYPKGRVPGFVKKYDYIFTGKNKDVIDLQIDFNTLYLIEMSTNRVKSRQPQTGTPGDGGATANPDYGKNIAPPNPNTEERPQENIAPTSIALVSDNVATTIRAGGMPQASVDAGDLNRSLMLGAKGDMITLNLKIVGDPHFIKQDDFFMGQGLDTPSGQFLNNSSGSSLYMDGGELYVFVNFQSPVDYDETKGIADVTSSRYRYSEFSGVYKIITVDNSFSKGKFEQNLTLAKLLYDQEGKPVPSSSAQQRVETAFTNALTPTVNTAIRFAGPRTNISSLLPSTNSSAAVNLAIQGATALANGQGGSFLQAIGAQVAGSLVNNVVGRGLNIAVDKVTAGINDILKGPTALGTDYNTSFDSIGDFQYAGALDYASGFDSIGNFDLDVGVTDIDVTAAFEGLSDLEFGDFTGLI
jgi:hypothetical protein